MSSESLETLFSDSSKNKFARLFKPVEFAKKNKIKDAPPAKKKKPKHNFRTMKDREAQESQVNQCSVKTSESSNVVTGLEKEQRTCFVGNIGITENKKSITKFFKEFGDIESIRLRSVPVEGTAVDEDGNQSLVKKVCSNKQKFGDQKGSFNAYVVFKDAASVERAVSAANNKVFGERHIRVDTCIPSVLNPKSTVFLGSLPFYADEEELRNHFAKVLVGGHEDIDTVRIIRDPETLIGKGIAYVSFANHDAVLKALTLDQSKFRKRVIRISTCGKRTKRNQQRPATVQSSPAAVSAPEATSRAPEPNSSKTSGKKRKRAGPENDTPAARRIMMKKSLVKEQARGRTFNANKKKGKLGGVIKTAIKRAHKEFKK